MAFFSLPFLPFLSLKESVFYGGVLMQPCVAILTVWALLFQLKFYFGPIARLFAVIFFFFLQAIIQIYMFARPDHHTIIVLVGCWQLACFLGYLKQRKILYMQIAGIFGGVLLWVSIEGILFSFFGALGWIILWILGKEELKPAKIFMLYVFISSFIFLVLNPPYEGFFFLDNGRLSILPVMAFGFSALAFFIADSSLFYSVTQKPAGRLTAMVLLTIAFAVLFLCIFGGPKVVFAPYFPPEIKWSWANFIGEFLPVNHSFLSFVLFAFPSVLALIFGICAFKNVSAVERKALILTLIPLFFFFLMTLKHIRFSENAAVFSVFPIVLFWWTFLGKGMPEKSRIKGFVLCALYFFGVFYLSFCMIQLQNAYSHGRSSVYDFGRVVPLLSKGKTGSILLYPSQGPEAAWTTGRPVIGTPNHRNIEGIVDTFVLLYDKDRNKVVELLKKHSVTDILLTAEQKPSGIVFGLKCVQKVDGTPKDLVLYHVLLSDCY